MTIATLLFAFIAFPSGADEAAPRQPILLDFTATWCGPCQQMRPAVEQLIDKGYPVKPVDIDKSPDLAERYKVTGVPTFVVIDPETGRDLGRLSGARPVSELASLYLDARSRYLADHPATRETEEVEPAQAADNGDTPAEATPATDDGAARESAEPEPNPKPWETVVRIKVHGQGSIGFGSGTVIHSTPKESIILTCAHIFKLERGPQAHPSRFPRRITIDLFDGKLSGNRPAQVHYANETFEGEAIDYDFDRDVGLIRFRPGRRLPFAHVVPTYWKPQARMGMITVGCSEGHDATAWNTVVLNPTMKGAVSGHNAYEAVECAIAPKQGRSGGGLFTSNGYVAGVCDFAEPQGNRGLYATPHSIYSILDRNNLMALYAPVRTGKSDALLADRRDRTRGQDAAPGAARARAQSPDPERPGDLTLPEPQLLGIQTAPLASREPALGRTVSAKRGSWQPKPATSTTDLQRDPSTDTDRFDTGAPAPTPEPIEEPAPAERTESDSLKPRAGSASKWRPAQTPLSALTGAETH